MSSLCTCSCVHMYASICKICLPTLVKARGQLQCHCSGTSHILLSLSFFLFLSVFLTCSLSICLPTCPSIHLSVCPSVCLSLKQDFSSTYSSPSRLHWLASKSQGSACVYLSNIEITGVHHCVWPFWVLSIKLKSLWL